MAWLPNPGALPPECEIRDQDGHVTGYRSVHVRLFNGHDTKAAGQPPWPSAGGRPPTFWTVSRKPHPFEIMEFEIA